MKGGKKRPSARTRKRPVRRTQQRRLGEDTAREQNSEADEIRMLNELISTPLQGMPSAHNDFLQTCVRYMIMSAQLNRIVEGREPCHPNFMRELVRHLREQPEIFITAEELKAKLRSVFGNFLTDD